MITIITFKRLLSISLLIGTISSCSKYETVVEENNYTNNDINFNLYQLTDLPEITLTVPVKDWNQLLTNFDKNPNNDTKVVSHYKFSLNGTTVTMDSIGIRLRGNTSRVRPEGSKNTLHNSDNPDWHHCHFGLDFNKFIKGQKFSGLKNINLKWFKQDSNYARNIYSYDLFEKYGVWTAPQASYCKLTIHVEGDNEPAYYGVYAMIEALNEDYIQNRSQHWSAGIGNLWKASYGASLEPNNTLGIEFDDPEGLNSLSYEFDLKTNKSNLISAKNEFNQFLNDLNSKNDSEFEDWISNKMDVSLFLKTYAVNVIVGMWDDYWVNGNNFYFYFSPNGKAYFIPYDYDNSLGTSLILDDSGKQDPLQWGKMDGKPLINKILSRSKYKEEYKSYLKELIDPNKDLFHTDKSIKRLTTWRNLIEPYVKNATGEDMLIIDRPATWAKAHNYRLFTGDDSGKGTEDANFFKTKIKSIYW